MDRILRSLCKLRQDRGSGNRKTGQPGSESFPRWVQKSTRTPRSFANTPGPRRGLERKNPPRLSRSRSRLADDCISRFFCQKLFQFDCSVHVCSERETRRGVDYEIKPDLGVPFPTPNASVGLFLARCFGKQFPGFAAIKSRSPCALPTCGLRSDRRSIIFDY